MKKYFILACIKLSVLITFEAASAHPGGKDKYGGHWDHKRNEYHCHSATCTPPSCSSASSDYRCGNQYYGQGNYAPGGRNNPNRYQKLNE